MDKLEGLIYQQKYNVESTKNDLISKSESVIQTLSKIIENLKNNQLKSINPLGELQQQGQEVDRLCNSLSYEVKTLETLEYLKRKEINNEC